MIIARCRCYLAGLMAELAHAQKNRETGGKLSGPSVTITYSVALVLTNIILTEFEKVIVNDLIILEL